MRKVKIYMHDKWAGTLLEDEEGYHFQYEPEYIEINDPELVSLTLPLTNKPYQSRILFPFFDGLIPEGWLLKITEKSWKINPRDRMGILLVTCRDCIGAVSVIPFDKE